jgi:hypothetical protein
MQRRIGLTFDEVVELKTRHLLRMNLAAAAGQLQARGYDCRPQMLEVLVRDRVVTPAGPDAWSQTDVDVAAQHFEDCGLFTPCAAMCQAMGCRYADFLRPLREAASRESAKYGRVIPDDDQYFVMHRIPSRGGDNGHDAIISFTLCDDIRERLERGEEV